jgi:hypothetical protein
MRKQKFGRIGSRSNLSYLVFDISLTLACTNCFLCNHFILMTFATEQKKRSFSTKKQTFSSVSSSPSFLPTSLFVHSQRGKTIRDTHRTS